MFEIYTNLTVAIASELRDEAHVIVPDLNHLLTDVVLRAAGYGCASPPEERRAATVRMHHLMVSMIPTLTAGQEPES